MKYGICFHTFSLFILAVSPSAFAEDAKTPDETAVESRSVNLAEQAAARTLKINQVDTSRYPKVDIFTTVTENDTPLLGLTEKDFRVREDEVDQEPLTVEAKRSALSVAVTLDTSGSMSKALATAKEAAGQFVDTLEDGDAFAVLSFARSVQVAAPLGAEKTSAKKAIDGFIARGDTALFDALYKSIETLKDRPGRRAVVLLSDGVDDDGNGKQLSTHTAAEVLALAASTNIPVFAIGLGKEIDESVLKEVTSKSGGAFFLAPTADDLAKLYGSLGKQLTGQYQISYTSNLPSDGTLHRIQLGQGALKSVKEFTAPKGAGAAAPAPAKTLAPTLAPAVATQAPPTGPEEITLGLTPESATPISPNRTYQFTVPDSKESVIRYASVEAPSGSKVIGMLMGLQLKSGGYCCPELHLLDKNFVKLVGKHAVSLESIRVQAFTSNEIGGKVILRIASQGSGQFGAWVSDVHDAESGRDAGATEADAIPIEVGKVVRGYDIYGLDDIDSYSVTLEAGKEYEVKARPNATHSVAMKVYDADGVNLASGTSPNTGAVAKAAFTAASAGSYLVVVSTTEGDLGTYSLIIDSKGVASPPQPALQAEALPQLR